MFYWDCDRDSDQIWRSGMGGLSCIYGIILNIKQKRKHFIHVFFFIFQVTVICMVFCSAKKSTIQMVVTIQMATIQMTVDSNKLVQEIYSKV